jgi:hypothetical protein
MHLLQGARVKSLAVHPVWNEQRRAPKLPRHNVLHGAADAGQRDRQVHDRVEQLVLL